MAPAASYVALTFKLPGMARLVSKGVLTIYYGIQTRKSALTHVQVSKRSMISVRRNVSKGAGLTKNGTVQNAKHDANIHSYGTLNSTNVSQSSAFVTELEIHTTKILMVRGLTIKAIASIPSQRSKISTRMMSATLMWRRRTLEVEPHSSDWLMWKFKTSKSGFNMRVF